MNRANLQSVLISLFFLICLPLLSAAQERGVGIAQQGLSRRVALVMGNSTYADAPLLNPVNDARAMRRQLVAMGFEVLYGENLTQNQMKEQIRQFGQRLKSGGGGALLDNNSDVAQSSSDIRAVYLTASLVGVIKKPR